MSSVRHLKEVMSGQRQVRVFLNRKSGGGGLSAADVRERFALHGWTCEVSMLHKRLKLEKLAGEEEAGVVWVAAGGDGTVNAIASAVAGTGRAMGVLPVGTLNHFARDLGLPSSLDEAIAAIARGRIREIDACEGGGRVFVNNSSLGIYPALVTDRERMRKTGWNKWLALAVASARVFARFRCLEVTVQVAGQERRCRTPLLFVGNNRYALEAGRVGQRESLNTGRMWLYMIADVNRMGMLRVIAAALLGRVRGAGEWEEFSAESFTVHAKGLRLAVAFDGEVRRLGSPIVYRIRPRALRVICPAEEVA